MVNNYPREVIPQDKTGSDTNSKRQSKHKEQETTFKIQAGPSLDKCDGNLRVDVKN